MEAKEIVEVSYDIVEIKNKLWKPSSDSDELINKVIEISFKAGWNEGVDVRQLSGLDNGRREVVEAVLAIIESPKQINYRLKEITEYCEAKLKE